MRELVVGPDAKDARGGAGRVRKIPGEDDNDVDGRSIPPVLQ
jgi:hypothetical protein